MRVLGLTLGDWRHEATTPTDLLGPGCVPGVYVLSARCCGLKGALPFARHSWIAVLHEGRWTTIEITDEETLHLQRTRDGGAVRWRVFGRPFANNAYQVPYISDRDPGALWFGQVPRVEGLVESAAHAAGFLSGVERDAWAYPFRDAYDRLDNNCSKFMSHLLWRTGLAGCMYSWRAGRWSRPALLGFRDGAYWSALHGRRESVPSRRIASA
jgi:hypothetical protein